MSVRVIIATRIHLGKCQKPPTDLEKKIGLFVRFCYGDDDDDDDDDNDPHQQASSSSSSSGGGGDNNIIGVIAVDAEQRIAGYDLVESVRQLCTAAAAKSDEDGSGRKRRREIHVLPVQPWGNFTPALNALIHWACTYSGREATIQLSPPATTTTTASHILFVSAETTAVPRNHPTTLTMLQSHLTDDTLVVGAVLPGHDHHVVPLDGGGTGTRSSSTAGVIRELSGRTTPWNTLALWNLSKLSRTGFLLVSDGLQNEDSSSSGGVNMGGVEEAAVIALQQSLFPGTSKAKLVPVDGIHWEQDFKDPARRQWHDQKMQSKLERAAYQLGLLRLENGTVEHYFGPTKPKSTRQTLHFVVTGFGPFDTIAVNPTETICRNLASHLQQQSSSSSSTSSTNGTVELGPARLLRTEIIETSAEAAQQAVADIFSQCDPSLPTIVVHLGLNKNATCFHLEQCAYNEARFRVPDQRGYQPQREPVVGDRPIDDSITTNLDVHLLAERMTGAYPNAATVVSQDPGRFVCNYTYYRSLLLAQDQPNTTSLFVHVPDQTSLSVEECVLYVERLFGQLEILVRD